MSKRKSSSSDLGISGGKGDAPRSCFSKEFRDNYDSIDWGHKKFAVVLGEVPRDFAGSINDLVARMAEGASVKEWTKENDEALNNFCDKLETGI